MGDWEKPIAEIRALVAGTKRPLENPGTSYWATRKLRPGFRKLMENGSLKPQAADPSMDRILDEAREDASL